MFVPPSPSVLQFEQGVYEHYYNLFERELYVLEENNAAPMYSPRVLKLYRLALDGAIPYFEDKEDYKKCAVLKRFKDKLPCVSSHSFSTITNP